jgi:glycosyltransferase involved in cell wall biosynthesis
MEKFPLVSVGIPTYNRPEGLRKTLEKMTNQTYKNLQIIVADNCSENEEVKLIGEEFQRNDARVTYFRHNRNTGALNFQFTLEKAKGTFFMWAADDDDRTLTIIEELLAIIGNHSAAFSNYAVKYEENGIIENITIKNCAKGENKYVQARNFLQERIPSMIYGLYRTDDIRWFVKTKNLFDWFDCYLISKTILLYNGYAFSDKELYTAGIKGTDYEYKPMNPNSKRIFTYHPYFLNSAKDIFKAKISIVQKLKLMIYLMEVNFRSFLKTEKIRRNYKYYVFIHRVISRLSPTLYFYEH